ncbi:MAG: kelch repeat-containing protein [Planctomycetota bacterium]
MPRSHAFCALLAATLTVPAAAQHTWRDVSPATGPGVRIGHSMAFDEARGVTILFGGADGPTTYGDTWTYDGAAWTRVATDGPAPRLEAAVAYDPSRGRVVLCGGRGGTGALDDTWEWDGSAWRDRTASVRPAPRSGAAMTYVPQRGGVLLHGGDGAAGMLDDVWRWDGATWADLTAAGTPGPNAAHTLTYHEGLQRVIVFPSSGRPAYLPATIYDGNTWFVIGTATAPMVVRSVAAVYDRANQRVVAFGGSDASSVGAYPPDTWQWRGIWSNVDAPATPGGRSHHAMVYDCRRDRVVLYGGSVSGYYTGASFDDTWELEPYTPPAPYTDAAVAAFGLTPACPGASVKPLLGTNDGRPWMGETLDLHVGPMGGFLSPAPVVVALGLSDTAWGAVPLPLSMSFVGRPDCQLLVSPDATLTGVARGGLFFPLPLPVCTACPGTRFFAQVLAYENRRWVSSNALELVIGQR